MRTRRILVVPVLSASILLGGCGSSDAPNAGAGGPMTCPTESTQTLAKSRFVVNLGLVAGVFHRYLWNPYQAGTFANGAEGRTTALVKAGLATAFIGKQLNDAKENVKNDPQLCGVLLVPLTKMSDALGGLTDKIRAGDLAGIATFEGFLDSALGTSRQQGLKVVEQQPESLTG